MPVARAPQHKSSISAASVCTWASLGHPTVGVRRLRWPNRWSGSVCVCLRVCTVSTLVSDLVTKQRIASQYRLQDELDRRIIPTGTSLGLCHWDYSTFLSFVSVRPACTLSGKQDLHDTSTRSGVASNRKHGENKRGTAFLSDKCATNASLAAIIKQQRCIYLAAEVFVMCASPSHE